MFLLLYACFLDGLKLLTCCKAGALTVAKKLLKNVFATWGIPSTVSSDKGTHYTEQIIQALTSTLQTSWNYHCPCHLQLSGKVNRANAKAGFKQNKN